MPYKRRLTSMPQVLMADLAPWQSYLGGIISEEPSVQDALANDLGLHPKTIYRWSKGTVPNNPEAILRKVVDARSFSEAHRPAFIEAVRRSYPEFYREPDPLLDDLPIKEIPSQTYRQIVHTWFYVETRRVFPTITDIVARQLFSSLDADGAAQVSAQLLRCTPPASGSLKVRSLYAPVLQIGARPSPLSAHFPIFFGMESPFLAGITALLEGHTPRVFNEREIRAFPVSFPETVNSLVILPILRRADFAGCCIVSSSIPAYFNQARTIMVKELGILLAFALDEKDFYEPQHLAFAHFPDLSSQQAYEERYSFSSRMVDARDRFDEAESYPDQKQIETLAVQELEANLITLQRTQRHRSAQEGAPPLERGKS
ncbi:MAG TPA: hypothetical protein VH593_09450 [Ktedonobacteraceae bacterium]